MQVVDFFRLERSLQDRFIEAASGSVPPVPLAFCRAKPDLRVLGWWTGSVAAGAAVMALLAYGFGSLANAYALLPTPFVFALGGGVALALFAALRALAQDQKRDGLPYRAGAYLFPIGVVDAQSDVLRVHRFTDLSAVSQRQCRVSLTFQAGVSFDFETADPALAEQLVQQVEQYRQRVSGDSGPASSRELAALDPLVDTGFRSPFTPTESRHRSMPRWLSLGWLLALVVGAVLGPLAWKARNFVSEERLYAAARADGSSSAYLAYLARGGTRSEVAEVLLPRAELKDAIAKHSVVALEQFMARGKLAGIQNELQVALRQALLAELELAASKGSLSALVAFEQQQSQHGLVRAELELKKGELFQKAARSFAGAAQPSTPGLVGFFGRLLFYARKHGPEVEIRFRRRPTDSAKDAEVQLQKSAYYLGPDSLPSRFFEPADWEPRELTVGKEIEARLNREFAPDILAFKVGPSLEDDGQDLPKVSRPTLVITHRAEMSGAFMSKKPRGAFVGLGFMMRAVLVIPNDDQPLNFKFSAWLPPDLKRWEQPAATPQDVYEALGREGLQRFSKKLLAFLFKAP